MKKKKLDLQYQNEMKEIELSMMKIEKKEELKKSVEEWNIKLNVQRSLYKNVEAELKVQQDLFDTASASLACMYVSMEKAQLELDSM